MLTLLKIKNLALVDSLLWEPGSGFTCITGETGAGKSVIIGAIRLALGERADKSLIRAGEQTCSVEAVFHLPADSPVHVLLHNHGVPPCEDGVLLIKRLISASSSRQFLNDSPCTLNLIREIGAFLVDMHGPNDHRSLTSQERQLALLDAFGGYPELTREFSLAWSTWQEAKRAYEELEHAESASAREIDLLRFQVDEIESAGFTSEEVLTLEDRWKRARNSTRLRDQVATMLSLLDSSEQPGLSHQLRELTRAAHELERLDVTTASWLAPLVSINLELEELESRLEGYMDELDCDPQELAQLEERINLLESLKRKYGATFEDIRAHYDEACHRLDLIEHRSEHLEELKKVLQEAKKKMDEVGQRLSDARRMAAPKLAQSVVHHSRELGFRQAVFEVGLEALPTPNAHGCETAEFLFGPNPGEPKRPLRLIASSGELARIMLALKTSLADQDATPLLVFDEIDANVGGEIARAVGIKMRQLGQKHQVLSITHFPQVAALATHHFLVQKVSSDHRTVSGLREVREDERIEELVRMLGGGGNHARTLAKELLRAEEL